VNENGRRVKGIPASPPVRSVALMALTSGIAPPADPRTSRFALEPTEAVGDLAACRPRWPVQARRLIRR